MGRIFANITFFKQKKTTTRKFDEMNHVLAQHYGFTDEELDFIINYDIKYRMRREAWQKEEDE